MKVILPSREAAERHGWTHQVQWVEDGKPCFIRCRSGHEADQRADAILRSGQKPIVIDLRDALQVH